MTVIFIFRLPVSLKDFVPCINGLYQNLFLIIIFQVNRLQDESLSVYQGLQLASPASPRNFWIG
jgi:hypothetical protein